MLDEAHDFLSRRLAGRAVVYRTADLIAAGFLARRRSRRRSWARGNLVVLPYRGEAVWWYEKDRFEQKYFGHHGGSPRRRWKSRCWGGWRDGSKISAEKYHYEGDSPKQSRT